MADWSELHFDILVSILEKVRLIRDILAFGSVCKSWREAASASNEQQYLRPQIPWLMLPDRENHRLIYSLSKEDILPRNLYIPEMSNSACIGLNYGWVLTVSRRGEMNLVHPLSRSQIELPNQKSLDYYKQNKCWPSCVTTSHAALSANPSKSSDFVVMIVYGEPGFYLGYWRLGDKRWTRITNQASYRNLIHYQDRFYALGSGGVWVCSVSNPQDCTLFIDLPLYDVKYIVESKGDLLVVAREVEWDYGADLEDVEEETVENSEGEEEVVRIYAEVGYETDNFKVYKLDSINGRHKRIKSLGDRAIFVGHNTSISVDVSEFGGGLIKSNHIYFTDDHVEGYVGVKNGGGKDMGSYSLEDRQFTQFKVEDSLSRINPPFWFIPLL